MKWTPANEFKWEPRKHYHAKWPGEGRDEIIAAGAFHEDGTFFWNEMGLVPVPAKNHSKFLILDETEQSSPDAHEKEVMMQAFDKVRQIFESRSWIMEGRGSYPYNDDRYKEEVRYLYDEFETIKNDTWSNIESKSFEYRKQIIERYLKENSEARSEELKAHAVEFAEFANQKAIRMGAHKWGHYINGYKEVVTTEQLYNLFNPPNKNNDE